jgi:hypothetical protein
MTYFSPGDAFIVSAIESHVACYDVSWISGIHSENVKPNVAVGVGAAVSARGAMRWDLDPCEAAVDGLVQVMVGSRGSRR